MERSTSDVGNNSAPLLRRSDSRSYVGGNYHDAPVVQSPQALKSLESFSEVGGPASQSDIGKRGAPVVKRNHTASRSDVGGYKIRHSLGGSVPRAAARVAPIDRVKSDSSGVSNGVRGMQVKNQPQRDSGYFGSNERNSGDKRGSSGSSGSSGKASYGSGSGSSGNEKMGGDDKRVGNQVADKRMSVPPNTLLPFPDEITPVVQSAPYRVSMDSHVVRKEYKMAPGRASVGYERPVVPKEGRKRLSFWGWKKR
jgi:hypothetical protein